MNFPEQDLASVAAGMICFRVISRFASFPTFPLSSCLPSCLPACQQSMANIGISIGVVQSISSQNRKCIIAEEGEGVEDYDEFEEEDDYCLFLRIVVG